MSVGAGEVGVGDGGYESGTGLLSASTSETGCSPLGGSSTTSSAASCYCWRIMEIDMYRDRSVDKT